jgi:hypothetical protein
VASDLVTTAAAELYGTDPQEFTDRRKALVSAARAAGHSAAAGQIAALRKPTRAAWVVNRLARAVPDAPSRLAELAAAIRSAQRAKDGRRLRELSARRGDLIDDLTGQALAAARVADPPTALREDVAATLTAALADPEVAAQFAAGTLTRAAHWVGFGVPPPTGEEAGTEEPEFPVPSAAPGEAPRREPPRTAAPSRKPRVAEDEDRAAGDQDRVTEDQDRAAEDEEKRANARRKTIEDAERAVATAAANAANAVAAEERLEGTVRDLEQRLTEARAQLADARLRARRAEAAERKARQTLNLRIADSGL